MTLVECEPKWMDNVISSLVERWPHDGHTSQCHLSTELKVTVWANSVTVRANKVTVWANSVTVRANKVTVQANKVTVQANKLATRTN